MFTTIQDAQTCSFASLKLIWLEPACDRKPHSLQTLALKGTMCFSTDGTLRKHYHLHLTSRLKIIKKRTVPTFCAIYNL